MILFALLGKDKQFRGYILLHNDEFSALREVLDSLNVMLSTDAFP